MPGTNRSGDDDRTLMSDETLASEAFDLLRSIPTDV